MKKFDRMEAFVRSLDADSAAAPRPGESDGLHPCYAGYFTCFNRGEYYEAHDVLEHLWLQCEDASEPFYKGLIQFAGGFVHLRKQFEHPTHPKHGRRLAPASRLFDLAIKNLTPFAPRHLQLDVAAVIGLAEAVSSQIRASNFTGNPWHPGAPPQIQPEIGDRS